MPKPGNISDFWVRFTEMIGEPTTVKQKLVAKLFSVGQSSVTKWKTGLDTPALPRAREMAKRYGVSVAWLLDGHGTKFPGGATDPELARLLQFWDKLLPETKRSVVSFAVYQRSIQTTASPERIKDVHEKLPAANHKARKKLHNHPV